MIKSNAGREAMTGKMEIQVEVGNLMDGARFRISTLGFSGKDVVITGWVYGTKLFSNECRTRVRLAGAGKHVIFGDGDQSKRREFDANGASEVNYPTMVMVVAVTDAEYNEMTNPVHFRAGDTQATGKTRLGGANTMTDVQVGATAIDPKQVKAAQAKYTFQKKALDAATTAKDEGKQETAAKRLAQIVEQAEAIGISMAELTGQSPVAEKGMTTVTKKGATTKDAAKPTLKEQNAQRVASLKAKTVAKPKAAPKAKKLAVMNDCLCGCGTETGGKFAPGHDARVKGMLYKVERGEMEVADLPAAVQPLVKFAGKRSTAGKDTSDYRLVQSPVKIPGRPEVKIV